MEQVLIVIHLMVVIALVVVVLLQRSEGGALGMGGGGGGGFMSARGAANALTRTTSILAAAFFATSIGLGIYAKVRENPAESSIVSQPRAKAAEIFLMRSLRREQRHQQTPLRQLRLTSKI